MPRCPLTVLVPTFNEEAMIGGCLESARFADEIIVVDSFSSDRTVPIAREFGVRILEHEFGGYAQQKNWAIPQASHEWILQLDADERVTPALRDEILDLLRGEPTAEAYRIPRVNHFLGRRMRADGWGADKVIRLFRRHARFKERKVHEEIDAPGPLPVLINPLEHHSFRSFAQYWSKVELYSEWGAQQAHADGQRSGPVKIVLNPAARFVKMYFMRLGFLDGMHGLVFSLLDAFRVYLKYARLWEMRLQEGALGAPERTAGAPRRAEAGAKTAPPGERG